MQRVATDDLLSKALRALCLTRDYVGEEALPALDGWEWYEAGKAISEAIPDDEWAKQFAARVAQYAHCCANTGKCNNCNHQHSEGSSMESPYPSIWCGKGHWEGGPPVEDHPEIDSPADDPWADCPDFKSL